MSQDQFPQNPYSHAAPATQKSGMSTGMIVGIVIGVIFLFFLVCGGILALLLFPAVGAARTAAQRVDRSNRLKMVGLAIHNYHAAHRCLPAAVNANADGNTTYGWRVAIDSPQSFDDSSSWDDPVNEAARNNAPHLFAAVNGAPGETNIFGIVSEDATLVPTPNTRLRFRDVLDGASNTVIAIELPNRTTNWASTENLTPEQAYTALSQLEPTQSAHMLLVDGTVLPVSSSVPRDSFMGLTTRDGRESVNAAHVAD